MKFSPAFFSKKYFFGLRRSNYFNYNFYDNNRFWRSILQKIKKYRIKGRVLDVGCAFGFLLKRLEGDFTELHGIDISAYALKRAQKEIPLAKLKKVNIETDELTYPDEYFDLITALDVLEHTGSVEKSLNKLLKKLKPGGFLIISIPVKDTWAGKFFGLLDRDSSHISILAREEIFRIIKSNNLRILEKSYFLNLAFFKLKGLPVDVELVLRKGFKNKF